ncbi:MAG: hypothetical protein ACTS73_06830 [Arsenophonus sp. NEOnobi-MAG3]
MQQQTIQSVLLVMLRLKCLMSEINSGNGICFNTSLVAPYLKHAKSAKNFYYGCIPKRHISTSDFTKSCGASH